VSPAEEPRRHLVWTKGGHAEVLSLNGETVELRSTTSAPPGARLEATFAADPAQKLTIKSYGTRKEPSGAFALKGRLIDANTALRERVASLYTRETP
jgi:hypothetical protein